MLRFFFWRVYVDFTLKISLKLSRRFLWIRMVQNVGMLYSPGVMSREVNIIQLLTFNEVYS